MIDRLLLFTNQEILISGMYIFILFVSMYISLKHNVQPILTLLFLFTISLTYLTITSLAKAGFSHYFPGIEFPGSLIIFPGVFGIIITIKLVKGIFRIPYVVLNKILFILFIFFTLFQINEYLFDSSLLSSLIYNKSAPAEIGIMQFSTFQYPASVFPEIILMNPVTYLLIITISISILFLYVSSKIRYPRNNILFTLIILTAFSFISLLKTFPFEFPILNDRMMGLNVIQWGLILTMVLMTAFLIARENNSGRHKKEIMLKPPGEYRMLVIYLIISLISLQTAPLLNGLYIKLLFIGYFILTSYIIFYFMRKIERHYLKYGTVSIIILIFVSFLMAQIPSTEQTEVDKTEIALK
jgi:hypothetical protein